MPSFLSRRTSQVCAALAVAAAGCLMAPAPASAATSPVDFLGVTGTNHRLYAMATDSGRFVDLGGELYDAPLVVAGDSDDYFIGIGGGNVPYIRSFDRGWQALGPVGTRCTGPSAAVSGSTLTVGCRGADGKLYTGTARLVAGELPRISSFVSRGGAVLYGSLAGPGVNGSFEYLVVGTNHAVYRTTSTTTGFTRVAGAPLCYGSLSADDITGAGPACRAADGSLTVTANNPADADGLATVRGAIVGRPGVTVDDDGAARYYVVGTNSQLYKASQTATGVVSGFVAGPAGSALYGVTAASLTSSTAAALARTPGS